MTTPLIGSRPVPLVASAAKRGAIAEISGRLKSVIGYQEERGWNWIILVIGRGLILSIWDYISRPSFLHMIELGSGEMSKLFADGVN